MRLMSFALTTDQVRRRQKHVTRRLGWDFARPGMVVQPIVKGMGLKPGEKVERISGPIRIVSVRREPLRLMVDEPAYGKAECVAEGFPEMDGAEFVSMFCAHANCQPEQEVNRIEFEYV